MNIDHIVNNLKIKLEKSKKPLIISSFGKDSMLTIWLVKKAGFNPKVLCCDVDNLGIHCMNKCDPDKSIYCNDFKRKIIKEWKLNIEPIQSHNINFIILDKSNSILMNYVRINDYDFIYPNHLRQSQEENVKCILNCIDDYKTDCLVYETDLCITGAKITDYKPDEWLRNISIEGYSDKFNYSYIFNPIFNLNDDDVWEVIEENNIPYNETIYKDKKKIRKDYFNSCWNCINDFGEKEIWCPKYKIWTNNFQYGQKTSEEIIKYYSESKIFV